MADEEKKPDEYIANTKISGGIDGKTILPKETPKTENGVFNERTPSMQMKKIAPIIILIGLLLVVAGGAYYFLVYKPKTNQVPIMEEIPVVEEVPTEASPSAVESDPQIQNLEKINQIDNLNQMEIDLNDLDFSGFDTEVQDLKF